MRGEILTGSPAETLQLSDRSDIWLDKTGYDDESELYELLDRNRDHIGAFQRWARDITPVAAELLVHDMITRMDAGSALQYRIMTEYLPPTSHIMDERMLGTVTMFNRHIPTASAELGYWLDKDAAGQGIAYEATSRVIEYATNRWGLHQIYLDIAPENIASIRLAKKLGAVPTRQCKYHETDIAGNVVQLDRYRILTERANAA